jgi:hypothetical protein
MHTATETEAPLREWVREHKVTWELGPWKEMVGHGAVAVGFELRLLARYPPEAHPMPGCHDCAEIYQGLREVALVTLPREHRPTLYEIEPFQAALHLRRESEWAPEVQLAVHIIHREGYLRPLDECERRCAAEIEQNLARLGVQPGRWANNANMERR